jgi:hypothetical protein
MSVSNISETQPLTSEKPQQPIFETVERPKGVWFVCLFLFLFMSLVFREGERYLASGPTGQQNSTFQIFAIGVLLALFLLVHGVLFLKPLAIKTVIGLFAITIVLSAYQFIELLIKEKVPYFGILAIRVIPPALAVWYLARPSFIELSKRYNKYRERKAMDKYIQKKLLKR